MPADIFAGLFEENYDSAAGLCGLLNFVYLGEILPSKNPIFETIFSHGCTDNTLFLSALCVKDSKLKI